MSDEHGSDFVDELMEFLLRNYYSMMIKRVKRFFPNKFDAVFRRLVSNQNLF